jgi:flagellar basal-body rod protein FlgB
MISALFNQPNYVGAKKMLDATVLRHQAIATNIANLETPQYRRIDLAPSFQTELKRAVTSGQATQIAGVQPSLAVDASAVAANRDGNTVRLENELIQLNQNQLQHTLETQLVTGALVRLRTAIIGRYV